MASLKEFLKTTYNLDPTDFEAYELWSNMKFASLPQVKLDDDYIEDADKNTTPVMEKIDFENNEILNIDLATNTITFNAGGDWQEPVTFSVTLKDDGYFHYNNDAREDGYTDGLSTADIIALIS